MYRRAGGSPRRVAGRRRTSSGPEVPDDPDADAPAPTRGPGGVAEPIRALRLIGSLIAPTTVLTALLWYFGRTLAISLLGYLGVDGSVLAFTTQDYLVRSADALFVPVTLAAGLTLAGLWTDRILRRWVSDRIWQLLLRVLLPVSLVAGAVLVAISLDGMRRPDRYAAQVGLPGLCLAAGVVLLDVGFRAVRGRPGAGQEATAAAIPAPVRIAGWVATFVLVTVGLFWATHDYAAAVGTGRGEAIEAALPTMPDAVLYSAKRLALGVPGVHETQCRDPQAAYRYRYDGMKLVIMSGDQYLFLPGTWTYQDGVSAVVRRDVGLRLEFAVRPLEPTRPC
jgi:hypothetical protein